MDIDQLQAFVTVAESGSFSQAAQRLFVTQPAVSKRVAALERDLDAALFDRIGHRVLLTEAGTALLPRARQVLAEVEDSQRLVSNLSGAVTGPLHLATSHHIGLHRLPPVLRAFTGAHPAVELDLRFMDSETACHTVERGERELAVVTLPVQPPARLRVQRIWHDALHVVVGRDHPLAGIPEPALRELGAYPAVLPGPETFTRQRIQAVFEPLGIPLNVTLSTSYLETIKMLVTVGLGWSVLPHTMLDAELRTLAFDALELTRELGVVTHRDRTLTNAARAMITTLGEHADGGA